MFNIIKMLLGAADTIDDLFYFLVVIHVWTNSATEEDVAEADRLLSISNGIDSSASEKRAATFQLAKLALATCPILKAKREGKDPIDIF